MQNLRWKIPTILCGLFFCFSFFTVWLFSESVHAASYSPYDIESKVKEQRWDTEGNNSYKSNSGKRIHYDIYKGSGSSNKKKYTIEQKDFGKGKETFLTFTGWSVIAGYTHHDSTNQSTYILARNEKENKEKMYRAQMTSLDASKDIEWNRQSSTGSIYNPCKKGVYNKESTTCNMYYKSVGFKAWLPLNDLFPDENKSSEWELYIVKRVGSGSKMNVVYDQLITPFEFEGKTFQKGTVTLSSGENAKQLKMLTTDAVRRGSPRGTDNGGNYFTYNKTYTTTTESQKYTMIWYGVRSPHDGDKTRYAASLYWRSQGTQAVISYDVGMKTCPDGTKVKKTEKCTVDVTIKHVDIDTNNVLKTETLKSTVGDDYEYLPKKKGTFTTNGIPYSPYPSGQKFEGTTNNNNMNFTFTYRAKKDDDSSSNPDIRIDLIKQGEDPKSNGYFFWELRRTNPTALSQVYVEAKFNRTSNHYAVRNTKLTIMGPNISKQDPSSITFATDAKPLKKKKLTYDFTFEYTNYYRDFYVKEWYYVSGDEDSPGYWSWYWKFDRRETAWDKGDTFILQEETELSTSVSVLHKQKETFELGEMKELEDVSLMVGKRHNWTNNSRTLNKTYYEKFSKPDSSKAKSENNLHTQTSFVMEPDRVNYEVELPSDEHKKSNFSPLLKQGSSGFYYPVDVDKSLQGQYQAKDEKGNTSTSESEDSTQTDTKFVTGQLSANYEDAEGYKGTLSPYVYGTVDGKTETKYVTNQTSASYQDSEGYKGALNPYVASGYFTPSAYKTVTEYRTGTFTCSWQWDGGDWFQDGNWTDTIPSSVYYNSDGYSGNLPRVDRGHITCSFQSMIGTGIEGSYAGQRVTAPSPSWGTYTGSVKKPSEDTRVWRYQGTVEKKTEGSQEIRYQGYVTKTASSPEGGEEHVSEGAGGQYAFPLQMKRLNQLGIKNNIFQSELQFVTDHFFMSKDFGYVGYYSYAERVKENLVSGKALPSQQEILNSVTSQTSLLFKNQTGEDFEDTFLYTDHTESGGLYGTTEKLQRYWIPIDAASSLENGMEYSNEIELNDMGLSDVSFLFAQKFTFELYLMGSIHDEVANWEQVEPRLNVDYPYSVVITPEQRNEIYKINRNSYMLHSFRSVDTKRLYKELKNILNTSFGDWW
ncbi:hypothetical protein [Peribacillus asahii]|uniref:hypothetical protein n=1 Tax=Peribacillus asahii TaxID=228899 RepID=UPI002079E6C5|nr:hypothetical protein [Peribacillus asahii]USK62330.1 hypothetical protein LIT37_22795 [Peribacillus asahii]